MSDAQAGTETTEADSGPVLLPDVVLVDAEAPETAADAPATDDIEAQAPESDAEKQDDEDSERDDKGRFRRKPAQPRFDELTREKHEAIREAEFWRARAMALEAPKSAPQAPTADPLSVEPVASDFADEKDYLRAMVRFEATQIVRDQQQQAFATLQHQQVLDGWQARQQAFIAETPDYTDVVGASEVQLSPDLVRAMIESEMGPQIAYHLAQHPDESERFSSLKGGQLYRELGRLEGRMSANAAPSAPTTAPARRTNASPPIAPMRAAPDAVVSLDKADMDTYIATRIKQGASWRR